MKALWTTIALIGFISISFFGVFLMSYDGSDHDASCIASLINGSKSPCPQEDPFGYANFHNNALRSISALTLVDYSFALYALVVAFIFFGLSDRFKLLNPPMRVNYFYRFKPTTGYLLPSALLWFALHEKRDPVSVF